VDTYREAVINNAGAVNQRLLGCCGAMVPDRNNGLE
jgi:hypothetical protein